ncbi:DUF192 domain-containing protein [Candidatus Woesearchaeota archaeon]|nr:DUF192 domain-containing protein [Candidatus Woesearchaeota archaeon]
MPILNATRQTILAVSFEECRTFWEQTRGMMFRKEVIPLVFHFEKEQTIRLHSWFCPGAMDLVFLNDAWEVVEMRSEWEPKSSYHSFRPALFLLELPVGTIAQSKTEVGDVVQILK